MAIRVPAPIREIIERLEAAGHETWCVGGAVRDALLGGAPSDFDLATAATPAQVRALFRRTVPVGIEHGTIGVFGSDNVLHEVTTFRRDVQTDGRHAVVAFGASLDEDLARRDFTINAIAWHPVRELLHDPFDGRGDLDRKVIRAVGVAADRFREDRLRIIRALRFAARLGFTIEDATWAAIMEQGPDTGHLSAERVRDEWVKSLTTAWFPALVAEYWHRSGVAAVWLPELMAPVPELRADNPAPYWPDDPVLMTALLARPTAPVWRRFKGSNSEIRRAEAIDRGPAAPVSDDPVAVRRWMMEVGAALQDHVTLAPWHTQGAGEEVPAWVLVLQGVLERGEATSRGQLAVTGNHLVAEGIVTPGPAMGTLLDRLLDMVIEYPELNRRDELLARARLLAAG